MDKKGLAYKKLSEMVSNPEIIDSFNGTFGEFRKLNPKLEFFSKESKDEASQAILPYYTAFCIEQNIGMSLTEANVTRGAVKNNKNFQSTLSEDECAMLNAIYDLLYDNQKVDILQESTVDSKSAPWIALTFLKEHALSDIKNIEDLNERETLKLEFIRAIDSFIGRHWRTKVSHRIQEDTFGVETNMTLTFMSMLAFYELGKSVGLSLPKEHAKVAGDRYQNIDNDLGKNGSKKRSRKKQILETYLKELKIEQNTPFTHQEECWIKKQRQFLPK